MKDVSLSSVESGEHREFVPGVVRTNLCYNDASMLCHFALKKGGLLPLHSHVAAQNGYVISGRIRFFFEDGSAEMKPGDGYLFESGMKHGLEVLEDSVILECFTPMRPEYI